MTDTELCANYKYIDQCDAWEYECPAFKEIDLREFARKRQICPECGGSELVLHPLLDSYFPCPTCTEIREEADKTKGWKKRGE